MQKEIIIYSKDNCPKCEQVKQVCSQLGLKFIVKNITHDLIKLTEFREKFVGAGFPVVEFPDGMTIAGNLEEIYQHIENTNK